MARKDDNSPPVFIVSGEGDIRLVKVPMMPETNPATGQVSHKPGVTIEFSNGRYVARDPEIAEWLRNHPKCGGSEKLHPDSLEHGQSEKWFVELGNEPGRPKPEVDEVLAELQAATVEGNVEKIIELHRREFGTHQRREVLQPIEASLTALDEAGVESAGVALEMLAGTPA